MTWHIERLRAGLGAFAILLSGGHAASAQGYVSLMLAEQLRSRGYPCDDDATSKRDIERSTADELVWNVKCKNGPSYRMYLKPNTPARVERLD
ncbi:MAG: hypothetical protein ABW003_26820 [Microvirga sp.]